MTLWLPHVPVVKQSQRNTCGPAALSAALRAFAVAASEADLALELGTGPGEGTTPEALANVTVALGLEARVVDGLTVDELEQQVDAGHIAIAGVQWPERPWRKAGQCVEGHYVVVMRIERGRVYVMDPLQGYGYVTKKELDAHWRDKCGGACRDHMAVLIRGPQLPRVAFAEKEFKRLRVPQRNPPKAPPPTGGRVVCSQCGRHISGHALAPVTATGYCRPCMKRVLEADGFTTKNPFKVDYDDTRWWDLVEGTLAILRQIDASGDLMLVQYLPQLHRQLEIEGERIARSRAQGDYRRDVQQSIVKRTLLSPFAGEGVSLPDVIESVRRGVPGLLVLVRIRLLLETVNEAIRAGVAARELNPAPQCPACKVPLDPAPGGSFNCGKCMRWFPGDSGWLHPEGAPTCSVCRRKLDAAGRCYKCDVRRSAEDRRARVAKEKEAKRLAREEKKRRTAERREERKRPLEDSDQRSLFNPRRR